MSKDIPTKAYIDDANKAMIVHMRDEGCSWKEIADAAFKTDGTNPTKKGCREVIRRWNKPKGKSPGAPRKTTADEDRLILRLFKKLRAKGYVDAAVVHRALPRHLQVGPRAIHVETVRSRINVEGYTWQEKATKGEVGPKVQRDRMDFCKRNERKTEAQWLERVQAMCDFKDFTWFPPAMLQKVQKFRCKYTYLKEGEKLKPGLTIPKEGRWFKRKEYKKAKKVKIFGCVLSSGASWATAMPRPCTSEAYCDMIKKKFLPMLKRRFPERSQWTILIDGEKLMHTPMAKALYQTNGIKLLPRWPAYSPDLNPQEIVWWGNRRS